MTFVDGWQADANAWGIALALAVVAACAPRPGESGINAWAKANMRPLMLKARDTIVSFAKAAPGWANNR